jgi:hypothetical protein
MNGSPKKINIWLCLVLGFLVLNATFNNISVISWRSVLLVEETGVPGENHRPAASNQFYYIMFYTSTWARFELTLFTLTDWVFVFPLEANMLCVHDNNVMNIHITPHQLFIKNTTHFTYDLKMYIWVQADFWITKKVKFWNLHIFN